MLDQVAREHLFEEWHLRRNLKEVRMQASEDLGWGRTGYSRQSEQQVKGEQTWMFRELQEGQHGHKAEIRKKKNIVERGIWLA